LFAQRLAQLLRGRTVFQRAAQHRQCGVFRLCARSASVAIAFQVGATLPEQGVQIHGQGLQFLGIAAAEFGPLAGFDIL
jgi:hypothetical protein